MTHNIINTALNLAKDYMANNANNSNSSNNADKNKSHVFGPTYNPASPPKNQIISASILFEIIQNFSEEDKEFIKSALVFADEAHLGQYRHSGEPYITHPLAVAEICAQWKLGKIAICSALLHDVIEDQGISKQKIIDHFGEDIANVVDGLTKLTHIEFNSKEDASAANFEHFLNSSIKDYRVLLVKIADRLHNMRTLKHMKQFKQISIAKETQEIYAPLAKKIGLHEAYNELQELSFIHIYPWRYEIFKRVLDAQNNEAQHFINNVCSEVNKHMNIHNINGTCSGKVKKPYVVYLKLKKKRINYKNFKFKDLQNLISFELIVNKQIECYSVLSVLHNLFNPKPGCFKDYVALPKRNGYQAIHTTLIDNNGYAFTVQIRTIRMQKIAQSGIISNIDEDKNENTCMPDITNIDASIDEHAQDTQKLLMSLYELHEQITNFKELLYYSKIDLSSDEIVVFNEKGTAILIPRFSTALDFAYYLSIDIGHSVDYIEVNGIKTKLDCILKNGDLIKIKSNLNSANKQIKLEWLKIVNTSKAKIAIQNYLQEFTLL
jgi:GTP diphosphokinase / guanosine-3',5'-bis(diphosphate) 3'-diphosphatase